MMRFWAYVISGFAAVAVTAPIAQAEVKPPGQFLTKPPVISMVEPPGQYRSTLGYAIASTITYRNASFGSYSFGALWLEGLQAEGIKAGLKDYRAAQGMDHMIYAAALARDLSHFKLKALEDNQLSMAVGTMPGAILSDIAAACLVKSVPIMYKALAKDVPKLPGPVLGPPTLGQAHEMAKHKLAFKAAQLRYSMLMSPGMRAQLQREVAKKLTPEETAKLLSESVLSAVITSWAASYGSNSEFLMEGFRNQLIRDVATYQCPCAMDPDLNGPPVGWIFGQRGTYLTRLGYLLSQQLAPAWNPVLSWNNATSVADLLAKERRDLAGMRSTNPAGYSTYMRAFLMDLEVLEREQFKALENGAALDFIESASTNVVFGLLGVATGGGTFGAAVAILGNASWGAIGAYDQYSDEIRILIGMEAMRERALQEVVRYGGLCGCGAGVVVTPVKVIRGKVTQP